MGREAGLLATAREQIRTRHMSYRTEKTYLHWMHRFILFHERRHPREMGAPEVEAFLTHLPVVLTRAEVARVMAELQGNYWLIAGLLYGGGSPAGAGSAGPSRAAAHLVRERAAAGSATAT